MGIPADSCGMGGAMLVHHEADRYQTLVDRVLTADLDVYPKSLPA